MHPRHIDLMMRPPLRHKTLQHLIADLPVPPRRLIQK
jgi:hypothetical protein